MDTDYLSLHLNEILACLRAQYLSYQTSHWQASGRDSYQDHLLFERLYKSVEEQIDTLAEKLSGLITSDEVSLAIQGPKIQHYLSQWEKIKNHHERGLHSEKILQHLLRDAIEDLEQTGQLTLGLDDFIAATASEHETNMYLLQQSLRPMRQNPRRKNPKFNMLTPIIESFLRLKVEFNQLLAAYKRHVGSGFIVTTLESICENLENWNTALQNVMVQFSTFSQSHAAFELQLGRFTLVGWNVFSEFTKNENALADAAIEVEMMRDALAGLISSNNGVGNLESPIVSRIIAQSGAHEFQLPTQSRASRQKSLWRKRRKNPASTLGSSAVAGIAGFLLSKK